VYHSPEHTEYPDNRFTVRQLKALSDEPALEVVVAPDGEQPAKPTRRRAKK
jgi:hypothetical protein